MADYAIEARDMGVGFIGACCGVAPHHIRAMAEALGRTVPASTHSPKVELHPVIGDDAHTRDYDARTECEARYGIEACREMEEQGQKP
jgi:betaine-homocysteine S-methyltransferase